MSCRNAKEKMEYRFRNQLLNAGCGVELGRFLEKSEGLIDVALCAIINGELVSAHRPRENEMRRRRLEACRGCTHPQEIGARASGTFHLLLCCNPCVLEFPCSSHGRLSVQLMMMEGRYFWFSLCLFFADVAAVSFNLHLHLQISKDEAAMRGEGLAPSWCEIGPRSAYTSSLPPPPLEAIFFISIGCNGRRCRHCHAHIRQGRASIAITHSKRSCQPPSGTCKWPTICQEPDASWGRAQERKEEEEEI